MRRSWFVGRGPLVGPGVLGLLGLLVVFGLAACGDGDAAPDGAATSTLSPLTSTLSPSSVPSVSPPLSSPPPPLGAGDGPTGFDTVLVRATAADGTICERCLWLADDQDERAHGLMGVTDLGGLDGMAFRYDDPGRRTFWMKNTLLPLSIVFIGEDGQVVGTADMAPCGGDPCPSYGPDAPFVVAIEVAQGRLDELGLGAGSVVELVGDCPG